ncbi:MAG: Na/Pi symporter [Candidatus Marinimicrobia bacterium]|nr:Na/Pi symporter [Candidatus Neomarinimicrobiota bacterium]
MLKQHIPDKFNKLLKTLALLGLVYIFLLSITLIGTSFKMMGNDTAEAIMHMVSNPVMGLVVGIFTTSLVQSSSLTTSLVVSMVAGHVLTIDLAIPIIMGANIGTSITNLIVSIGHIQRSEEFERALGASIVHDFFNVLSVAVIFPLQLMFNIIGISARAASGLFVNVGGLKFVNPLNTILKPVADAVLQLFPNHPWIGIVIAFILLFVALRYLVVVMKSLVLKKIEAFFDQYIFKTAFRALLLGMFFTALVQSSSITTSLVVPLAAAGVLSLKKIFPYDLGANVGTTITAFLASLATSNADALTIAFSHLLFNVLGILIWLPLKNVPITMATVFARWSVRHRWIPIAYILLVFFLIPLLLILLMR